MSIIKIEISSVSFLKTFLSHFLPVNSSYGKRVLHGRSRFTPSSPRPVGILRIRSDGHRDQLRAERLRGPGSRREKSLRIPPGEIQPSVVLLDARICQIRAFPAREAVVLANGVQRFDPGIAALASGEPLAREPCGPQPKGYELLGLKLIFCAMENNIPGPVGVDRCEDKVGPHGVSGAGIRPLKRSFGAVSGEESLPLRVAQVDFHNLLDPKSLAVISPSAAARSAHQTLSFS